MAGRARRVPIETEWQFDSFDLGGVERWIESRGQARRPVDPAPDVTIEPRPAIRQVDTYYDTAQWHLGRAGYSLRLRRSRRGAEATLKDLAAASDGLRQRLELNEQLESASISALSLDGEVGRRVRALTGPKALRPLIEVTTRRRPHRLVIAGTDAGELALDETTIQAHGASRRIRLQRVEVEVDSRQLDRLGPFVASVRSECGLQPALLSKFEFGLRAAGLSIPGPADFGNAALDPGASVAECAFAVLRRAGAAMCAREAGTRLGEDIEELHQMRVATRRLRAAITLFADVLPVRARSLEGEISWLAEELGKVRDLDVELERLADWATLLPAADRHTLTEIKGKLKAAQADAREELLVALDSRRYARLVSSLTTMLVHGPLRRSARGRVPALVAMPELIATQHRSAAEVARRARRRRNPEQFHKLRIRCKRLRYTVEFASDLYGGAQRQFVAALAELQNELGKMQDAEVAAAHLRSLATAAEENQLSPAAVFAIGGIAERCRSDQRRLFEILPERLSVLSGSRWRRLDQVMTRKARAVAPPARAARRTAPPLELVRDLPDTASLASTAGEPALPDAVPPRVLTPVGGD